MRVYSESDIGLVRNSNQDCCSTGVFSENAVWAVVCDGMGGANGGCVASSVAVNSISEALTKGYNCDLNPEEIREMMQLAVKAANSKVYDIACGDPSLSGMGTTVVCAVAVDETVHIVHAGDSRAYLSSEGTIQRVTTDHSIVQELVRAGQITEDQARSHPNRNIITRALGVEPELYTDYNSVSLKHGDKLLICTDGLSGYFSDSELCDAVGNKSGEELVATLIESAKEHGGSDNITVAVIEN